MKNKRGVYFSIDALIALIIVLAAILILIPIVTNYHHNTSIENDLMVVLSTIRVGEINDSYIKSVIEEQNYTKYNNSILEMIGEFYVRNITTSKIVAQHIIDNLEITDNIGIWYNDEMIASKNSTEYESASVVQVDRQIISGIQKGREIEGFVAKAWLKKISEKRNSIFLRGDFACGGWRNWTWGEYCGNVPNKITYQLYIPLNSTILDAYWLAEGSWVNQTFEAYVNNNLIYNGRTGYYIIFNITEYLNPGMNEITFNSTQGGDDGASHIVVDYSTPEMQTFSYTKTIPFNFISTRAPIRYEKPIFLAREINGLNVTINSSADATLTFRRGASSVLIGQKSPVNNISIFTNSEIKSALEAKSIQYSDLNNQYFFLVVDLGKNLVGQNITLGTNSLIEMDISDSKMPFGTIDLIQKIPITQIADNLQHTFYKNILWEFFLPKNAIPIIADYQFGWLSTSNFATTQRVSSNNIVLFNSPPEGYIKSFNRFGYTPSRANGVFIEGKNNFSLNFGDTYGVSSEASNGFLTYFIRSYVSYGEAKSKASGGTRVVEFQDGSTKTITIGNASDAWDPEDDALDDAIERLLQQIDSNEDGKIDLIIDENELDVDAMDISGVPFIWSTEVQIRRWK
jgi:hypothetical protein